MFLALGIAALFQNFVAAIAASARARAYGRGGPTLRPLLASTSLAALMIGGSSPAAFAQVCGTAQTPAGTTITNTTVPDVTKAATWAPAETVRPDTARSKYEPRLSCPVPQAMHRG